MLKYQLQLEVQFFVHVIPTMEVTEIFKLYCITLH